MVSAMSSCVLALNYATAKQARNFVKIFRSSDNKQYFLPLLAALLLVFQSRIKFNNIGPMNYPTIPLHFLSHSESCKNHKFHQKRVCFCTKRKK